MVGVRSNEQGHPHFHLLLFALQLALVLVLLLGDTSALSGL
jgi:hypothetical protein